MFLGGSKHLTIYLDTLKHTIFPYSVSILSFKIQFLLIKCRTLILKSTKCGTTILTLRQDTEEYACKNQQ